MPALKTPSIACAAVALAALLLCPPPPAEAHGREDWIALGTQVHGGFGALIPIGIRIGLDALQRLNAKPREVTVTYYDSEKAPCACVADGIMIATTASPGQRTLTIAAEKAPPGALLAVVVRHRKTGAEVRYTVAESWMPRVAEWNRTLDPAGRYDAVMAADGLFEAASAK